MPTVVTRGVACNGGMLTLNYVDFQGAVLRVVKVEKIIVIRPLDATVVCRGRGV